MSSNGCPNDDDYDHDDYDYDYDDFDYDNDFRPHLANP